jgi:hypothetical protein
MADTATTPTIQAAAGTTPTTDWDKYQQQLGERVSDAGKVYGGPYTGEFKNPYSDVKTELGQEAIKSYGAQYDALQQQAKQSATGLEMVGQSTMESQQRLEALQADVTNQFQSALDGYNGAVDKAAEYAEKSDARIGENLATLDDIFKEWNTSVQFDKAHAMQTAVVSTMEGFKMEERQILENYGVMSPEYEQFRQGKTKALGALQSNIHASFGQLKEQRYATYMNVVNEAMWKQNMYTSFQEQQHVEMLKYMQGAKNEYFMQYTAFTVGIEQLKMAGMENLANWVVGSPSFTMDSTPLITLLAELSEREIIGTEPGFIEGTMGGRQSVGGKTAGGTTSRYQVDKPVYA